MTRNLRKAIQKANSRFLDCDAFADDAWHVPGGDDSNRVHVNAIVDWGSRTQLSSYQNASHGRTKEQDATIELDASIAVTGDGHDCFDLEDPATGQLVRMTVSHQLGRDAGLQTWALTRVSSREPSRRDYRGN